MTTRTARTGRRCARNPTGHGPAHLNKFAFRHNPNSAKTRAIAKIGHRRVCARCFDILEWRKTFRKYKPSKHARRCDECGNHSIVTAYHVICEPCSVQLECCAKCKVKFDEKNPLKESETSVSRTPEQIEKALAGFKERNRRTMMRAIENGVFTLDEVLQMCDSVGNITSRHAKPQQEPEDDAEERCEDTISSDVDQSDGKAESDSEPESDDDDALSDNNDEQSELDLTALNISRIDR